MKKRIFFLLILFFFLYYFLNNFTDQKVLIELLNQANWHFVILASLLQILQFFLLILLYTKSLNIYEIKWKPKEIAPLVLSSYAINAFTPLAPLPGSSIFLQKGRRDKIPALNITAAFFLVILFEYLSLIPILMLSLYFLYANFQIFSYELIAIFIFLFLVFFLIFILVLSTLLPQVLKFIFKSLEYLINKSHFLIKRSNFFTKGWSDSRTLHFIKLSQKLIAKSKKRKELFLTASAKHLVNLSTFIVVFLAFGKTASLLVILIGYGLTVVFSVVSPSPQGTGFVEIIIPLIFSSMGVNLETATLAILTYRGLNLWLPVILGLLILNPILKKQKNPL